MTQPLALVLYEKLLPGSQLVNRLQDLNYRVQTVSEAAKLGEAATQSKPMVVLVDLEPQRKDVCDAITRLKKDAATQHLPVIAFSAQTEADMENAARAAGATLVVSDTAIINHLPQILEQALQLE